MRVLALDGAGRLWLAGAGLWVVVGDRAVDLSSLPPLNGVDVIAMIADPHRRDGVIVSLGDRGLLYVATERLTSVRSGIILPVLTSNEGARV